MSSIFRYLNKFSIGLKISFGFFVILFIFGAQSIFNFMSMQDISKSFSQLHMITENTVSILSVDKNISDLQKLALTYGQTGSESIFKKIEKTYNTTTQNLNLVLHNTGDEKSKKLIKEMVELVHRYGENIKSLQERYKYRHHLIEEKFPSILQHGSEYLKKVINDASKEKQSLKMQISQQILQHWFEAHIKALSFIKTKKFKEKKYVYNKINEMKKLTKDLLEKDSHHAHKQEHIEFLNHLSEFKDIFDQSIQVNRIYLSLVNVIMAGEAIEFANLAKMLRTEAVERLIRIANKNKLELGESRNFLLLSLVLTLPFLLLIALLYNLNISRGIRAISDTFSRLLEGDVTEDVPGIERGDEIGQLASAANAFKDVSQKYKKAKSEAEDSARIKSEFLANMSHEIRTPMNGILGMVSLLQETKIDDEQKHMLNTVSACGDDLMTILNDILDFSKIESGQIVLEERSFNLGDCIRDMSFLFEMVARKKNINFSCSIKNDDFPQYIIGDVTRLKQVLTNLLSNAIKFTEQGGVKVEIATRCIADKRHEISFSVEDSGVGIDEESQKNLFKSFSQADASITRKFGGTGLGLAISLRIVKLFNSKIDVVSRLGVGSKFSFSVELDESEAPISPNKIFLERQEKSSLKILLAEDNLINIDLACLLLSKLNHEVDVAHNGEEAVNMAKKNKDYDLILMDMQMPVMDGVKATQLIKEDPKIRNIPIIAMTANILQKDRDRCFEVGMTAFISKPISKQRVCEVLDQVVKKN